MKTKSMARKNKTVKSEIKRAIKEWAVVGLIFSAYLLTSGVERLFLLMGW